MKKNGFKHINLEDRQAIEEAIRSGKKASAIAKSLKVSTSTITREIVVNRISKIYSPTPAKRACDLCARYDSCTHAGDLCDKCMRKRGTGRCRACGKGRCFERCRDFLAGPRCAQILAWPHTCDYCASIQTCTRPKIYYRAERAQNASDIRKSMSRRGICCNAEYFAA